NQPRLQRYAHRCRRGWLPDLALFCPCTTILERRSDTQEGCPMNEDRSTIATMHAITISREHGSGGGEIAARLAKRLQWRLIDHEVVVRVAQKLHVSEEEAQDHDERVESLATRILKSLRVIHPTMPVTIE